PRHDPLPGPVWPRHQAACHYRSFREVPASSARACAARHPVSGERFVGWHPTFAVAHVWAWYPNPDGVFAETNAWLAPYGGVAPQDHHAARNPAEMFYSQFTHRVAGVVLLILAALTVWESWRPRRFPWNAVSAPVWVAFGLYLIPTSDPESWPYGPQRFVEIFDDPLVLQHKLLALLPIAIGVIIALRAAAVLPGGRLVRVLGVLALAGGATLFFHFHDGRIHFDWISLQHAVMGSTAPGIGVALLVVVGSVRRALRVAVGPRSVGGPRSLDPHGLRRHVRHPAICPVPRREALARGHDRHGVEDLLLDDNRLRSGRRGHRDDRDGPATVRTIRPRRRQTRERIRDAARGGKGLGGRDERLSAGHHARGRRRRAHTVRCTDPWRWIRGSIGGP